MSPLWGGDGGGWWGGCLDKAGFHSPHFNQGLFLKDLKEDEGLEQRTSHIKGKCLL